MQLIDTHCHLDFAPLCEDVEGVVTRARERSVTGIVVPAYELAKWEDMERLGRHEHIYTAFGLHPWVANQPLDPTALAEKLVSARAVAVGEVGLDFKIDSVSRSRQTQVLREQLAVAVDLDLPVLLHCRGAFEELLAMLGEFDGKVRGIVHAYSRGPELMRRFIDIGLHIGFGGAITRPKASRARRSAARAPIEKIVLETDAPSIGLDGVDPEQVEPHHVYDIARALAQIRNAPLQEMADQTTANARSLLGPI